jgi:hypothetical protein
MKSRRLDLRFLVTLTGLGAILALAGCSSTGEKSAGAEPTGSTSSRAKADDGRVVEIGKSSQEPAHGEMLGGRRL